LPAMRMTRKWNEAETDSALSRGYVIDAESISHRPRRLAPTFTPTDRVGDADFEGEFGSVNAVEPSSKAWATRVARSPRPTHLRGTPFEAWGPNWRP
jgi:hypothetical protein